MTTEMLTYESAIESVKNNEQLKQSVFTKKYKYQDEATFEDTLNRMVKNLDIYLKKFDYPEKMLKEINFSTDCVRDGRFIPGGSILFGFGNTEKKNTLSNCYVTPIERDSIDNTNGYGDGIGDTITKFMRTFSFRGGLGTDITVLRPTNESVNNAAVESSGAVSFMPLISEVAETIGQCLAYDSLVLTKSGLKEIQHIVKNEEVWTKVGWVKVLDILKNKKKVFKLTTNNGFSIRASEDHVFQTLDKAGVVTEKPLRDFNINDRIVMIRGSSNEITGVFNYVSGSVDFNGKIIGGSEKVKTPISMPDLKHTTKWSSYTVTFWMIFLTRVSSYSKVRYLLVRINSISSLIRSFSPLKDASSTRRV